jgi:hypothetical protein
MYPYNYKMGQTIQTNAEGVSVDRGFIAHYHIPGEDAPAASSDGVLPATNLGAETQEITAGITNPAVPRNIRIDGNVSEIDGKVKITGTNFAGKVITEEIQANGTTAVDGNLAFRTVTKIELPIQDHTPAQQTETIQVTQGCSTAGDITVTITATTLLGEESRAQVTVTLSATEHDTAAKVATAIVEALNEDDVISAVFTASVTGVGEDTVTLTANEPAANDSSLAIAVDPGSTGMTVGSSTDGTSGIPYDKISVGWGDKLGLPYFLTHNTVLAAYLGGTKEANAPSVGVDADDLENNTIDLHSALNGTAVDIYLIV